MADAHIETAFQEAIDSGKINGAIICATDAEGRFTYEKTMGERTLLSGEKVPEQLDDVLFLASATKLMTTIAALQCVEDGLLTLKGDLSSVAPELASQKVLKSMSEDGKTPVVEPQAKQVTLEMLLTHSAGTSYHFLDPAVAKWRENFTPQGQNPTDMTPLTVEKLFAYPLSYQPGESWMYGSGLDWAGRIVERATSKSLGERMQERVFAPLGITDAQFYPVTRKDLRSRLVDLNPNDPGAIGQAVLAGGGEMNSRSQGDFGGHGLFMTGPGYLKVLRSLLANDGKILKPATVDSMFENHLSPEASKSLEKASEGPMGDLFRVGVPPGVKTGYGLSGLLTLEDIDGFYGERTLSWGGGMTYAWFVDRKNNICAIGAIQASIPTNIQAATTLKDTFRHDVYRKHAAWKQGLSS